MTSQTPNDKLIVGGVRVGEWTLDMTIDDLVRMNGPAATAFIMAGHEPEADAIRELKQYAWWGLRGHERAFAWVAEQSTEEKPGWAPPVGGGAGIKKEMLMESQKSPSAENT